MSVWIVRSIPVTTVRDGHVDEGRRALTRSLAKLSTDDGARGVDPRSARALDDEVIVDALWVTRALPAALVVLSDARAELDVAEIKLERFRVERRRRPMDLPLVALALYARGSDIVEVRFISERLLDDAHAREDCPVIVRMHVRGPLRGQLDDERPEAGDDDAPVIVRRFTHGRRDGR